LTLAKTRTVTYTDPDGQRLVITLTALNAMQLGYVKKASRAAIAWVVEHSQQPLDALNFDELDEATRYVWDAASTWAVLLPGMRVDEGAWPEAWHTDLAAFANECPADLYVLLETALGALNPGLMGVDQSARGKAPGDKAATA